MHPFFSKNRAVSVFVILAREVCVGISFTKSRGKKD